MKVLVDRKGRVLHISLNRPQKRNALDLEMCTSIVSAVNSVREDERIGSILIDAIGPVFCSGMDLDEARQLATGSLSAIHEELFTIGWHSLKPIIVSVNGSALGGGLGLLAQGHVVLVADGAVFGLTELRVGLWPFVVSRAVEAAIGCRRTLELTLMGRVFHAQEALSWGLAQQVSPPFELAGRAMGVAREIAKASPEAILAGLQYRRDSYGKTRDEAGKIADSLRSSLMQGGDFKEGCAAFKERREPHWPSMPNDFYSRKPTQAPGTAEPENGPSRKATGNAERGS